MSRSLRLAALALLWGSSFLWIDLALTAASPAWITLARLVLGAGLLLALTHRDAARVWRRRELRRPLVVAALLASVVPFTLFALAQESIAASVAGALNATTPVWSLLVALAVRTQRRARPLQVAGLVLGLLGVLLVLAPWREGAPLGGALLALAAAASYGAGYVYVGARLTSTDLPRTALAACQLTAAAVLAAPLAVVVGGAPAAPTTTAVLAVLVLGLGGTGLAYLLLYQIITDDGPVAASSVAYLLPVVAIVLGAVVLDDPVPPSLVGGAALVLLGVVLARRLPEHA